MIYAYNNSTAVNFKDDVNYRYVSNYYNRRQVSLVASSSQWSNSYTTTTWREVGNGSGSQRGYCVKCVTETHSIVHSTGQSGGCSACRLNNISSGEPNSVCYCNTAYGLGTFSCIDNQVFPIGYNWIVKVEEGIGGAGEFYGAMGDSGSLIMQ